MIGSFTAHTAHTNKQAHTHTNTHTNTHTHTHTRAHTLLYLDVVDAYGTIGEERMDFFDFARRQEGAVDAVSSRVVHQTPEHDHPVIRGRQLNAAAMLETTVITWRGRRTGAGGRGEKGKGGRG